MQQTSKLKQLSSRSLVMIKGLRDVRMVGLLIFVAVALLVTWSSVSVIQTNYELQQRIARLEQENELKRLENENLKLRNLYFETDQYLELQARRQFGKAAQGETLVLVPEQVAQAHSVEPEQTDAEDAARPRPDKPTYQKNFEAWMEFLFRRNAQEI